MVNLSHIYESTDLNKLISYMKTAINAILHQVEQCTRNDNFTT